MGTHIRLADQLRSLKAQRAERSFHAGAVDANGGLAFGRLVDVAVGGEARIYALDRLEHRIVVLDSAGSILRSIGRAGEGPGEFRAALNIALAAGSDSIFVFDTRLWRVSVFDTAGHLVRVDRPTLPRGLGQIPQTFLNSAGHVFNLSFDTFDEGLMVALAGARAGRVRGINTIQVWRSGNWHDLLRVPGLEVYVRDGAIFDVPFAAGPVWTPHATDGFWYADNIVPKLYKYGNDGMLHCAIELPIDVLPPSDSAVKAYYDASDGTVSRNADVRAVRARRSAIPMPAVQPVVVRMLSAGNGIWVNIHTGQTPVLWYRISMESGLLEAVSLPPSFRPTFFVPGSAYGVETDSLDVHYVARYSW